MTPKEKAKDLIDRFMKQQPMHITMQKVSAKQCALICVDEILKLQPLRSTRMAAKLDRYSESDSVEYWEEIKQEIKKL
ncbi:MAG: hypothetical protein GY928_24390 [Colwellia sp.]|nr:hypothetical protein [Colwellia sp.]